MTDKELMEQIRVRIMSEAYDLADRNDAEGYNSVKVMCSDVLAMITAREPQPNDFRPDWDAMAVMVEEQQRMAKRIEELEAQPNRPWLGLTDAELAEFSDARLGSYDLCLEVDYRLRSKNT